MVKHADCEESKCYGGEAEYLLKKVKEEWKWQRADGDVVLTVVSLSPKSRIHELESELVVLHKLVEVLKIANQNVMKE